MTDVQAPLLQSTEAEPVNTAREIDYIDRTRQKPMRVLVLGLSRTGTTSICAALRKLNYTPYQMRDLLSNPKSLPLWQEAVELTLIPHAQRPRRKLNRKVFPPYARPDFDKLLGEYDAVADLPGALFYKELLSAYPDAKVILTTRKYEDWEKSMQTSIWMLLTWRLFVVCRVLGITQMAPLTRLMHSLFRVHNGNHYGGPPARAAYEQYYTDVRALVPASNLLEISAGHGDWEQLCEFLGQENKKEVLSAYPNVEESASMEKGLRKAWWEVLHWMVSMFLVVFVSVGGVLALYYQEYLWDKAAGGLMVFEPLFERVLGFLEEPAGKSVTEAAAGAATGHSEL